VQGKLLKCLKNFAHVGRKMYRKKDKNQFEFKDFYLPFGGKLNFQNRWIKLSEQIPWDELEEEYANLFSERGAPAKSFRMALGALLIKEKLNISDEETVQQIRENPYLQYFIGLSEYRDEAPFDSSMMVYFRKRINADMLKRINEKILQHALEKGEKNENKHEGDNDSNNNRNAFNMSKEGKTDDKNSPENKGILMVDATVIPADITYPTDLNLLNEAREKLELMIDKLYLSLDNKGKKPRTYRNRARKEYLSCVKNKRISHKTLKKAIKRQLGYVRRDINHIENLIRGGAKLSALTKQEYRNLLVINELYRQQKHMYKNKTNRIEHRIVSIHQPYIRPIIRGKKSCWVEFGPKTIISRVGDYHMVEKTSWDNINEATLLQEQIERYKERTGYYPEAVLADQLYKTKANIRYCQERNIRFTGKRLGRSKQGKRDKELERKDQSMRNAIEGFFGVIKRRYGLDRLMTRLVSTSETTICLVVLLRNLEKLVRDFFIFFINTFINTIFFPKYHRFSFINSNL